MRIRWAAVVVSTCLSGVHASDTWAQSVDHQLPGRFEVAGGFAWTGPAWFGSTDATETAPGGGRFRLFSTSTRLESSAGMEARVGVRLTRALQAEAMASHGAPLLTTKVSADAENGSPVSATEPINQWIVQGALVAHLRAWHIARGGVPFLTVGAGYLRQLHQTHTLVTIGQTYHVGGGVKYMLLSRQTPRLKGLGVRADARAIVRVKGVAIDGRAHVSPAVAASIFLRF